MQMKQVHEHWSSRLTFIMAAVGSAVGLGNFWRFPYTAGENGGGAFVLIYILCAVCIALPILMAELIIGRRGGLSAPASSRAIAIEDGLSGNWQIVGWVGMAASFFILTFYSVIGGWIIAYIPWAFLGAFTNITAEQSGERFGQMLADPFVMMLCHSLFMILTVFIVSRGLKKGIEVAVNVLMPMFFLMLVGVVIFSLSTGAVDRAVSFLFDVDFSKVNFSVLLEALGQAFFSLSIGSAVMITYGAYLTAETRIPFASGVICFSDTLVAILAGLAIFPIVFAVGLDPAAGPGLIFVTLPVAFGDMPFGAIYCTLFFVLALFAALTSSIALFEIPVAWLEEHRGWSRRATAHFLGLIIWLIGLGSVFSNNLWSDFHPLGGFATFAGKTIMDILDYMTANIMMPLGGVLVAVFVGWRLNKAKSVEQLGLGESSGFRLWYGLLRWLAPVAIGSLLLYLTIGF